MTSILDIFDNMMSYTCFLIKCKVTRVLRNSGLDVTEPH